MSPKLKWERWFKGAAADMWRARSGSLSIYVGRPHGFTWSITATWWQKVDDTAPCVKLFREDLPGSVVDVVDAMVRCESRVRDVLLQEFGELLK